MAIVRYVSARGSSAIKMGAFLPRREVGESQEGDEDDDSPPVETQYCVFVQVRPVLRVKTKLMSVPATLF